MPAESHRIWRQEQHAAYDELTEVFVPALDHMLAGITSMGLAPESTQRRLSSQWAPLTTELAAEGKHIIDVHNPRLTKVSEAQAAAGGKREVAANKRYSQR